LIEFPEESLGSAATKTVAPTVAQQPNATPLQQKAQHLIRSG